jgi:hypothetical protein
MAINNTWCGGKGLLGMFAVAGLCVAGFSACNKKAPPPPPPPKAPPPAPTTPPPSSAPVEAQGEQAEPVKIDAVLAAAKSDPRVQFPQDASPSDGSVARAIVDAANALAKGNDGALRAMLQSDAQLILDGLVNSGDWETSTKRIEGVRVIAVNQTPKNDANATGFVVQMAVQEPGESYVIAWEGAKQGMGWKLTGAKAPAGTRPRASDWAETATAPAPAPVAVEEAPAAKPAAVVATKEEQLTVVAGIGMIVTERLAKAANTDFESMMSKLGQQVPPGVNVEEFKKKARDLIAKGVLPEPTIFKLMIDGYGTEGVKAEQVFAYLGEETGIPAERWKSFYEGK